jgi:SagB-type dehydrogenase family enzyme
LFILPRTPGQIVWNYKDHLQHELDLNYACRLAKLINNPNLFESRQHNRHTTIKRRNTNYFKIDNPQWGWDELSKIYHIGTQNIPCEQAPQEYPRVVQTISERTAMKCWPNRHPRQIAQHRTRSQRIALPVPVLTDDSLENALLQRKTCRSYTGAAITLNDVATLLYLSLGYLTRTRQRPRRQHRQRSRRASQQPFGWWTERLRRLCSGTERRGLEPGIYAYHPAEHALSRVNPLPEPALGLLLGGQHFINNLPLGLFITARFDKLWWKYEHSRAYRMAFVEAGHLSQSFQLVATALGLGTWLTGAFCRPDQVEAC